ncbi:acyl-CoA dehydrogenase family protein, partial [Halobellus sp. Atlit-38R]
MEFEVPAEQRAVLEEVRQFGENEIRPVASENDSAERYPYEIMEQAAELGLIGSQFPVEHGGVGYSLLERAFLTEELFAIDPGTALCITSADFGS